MRPAARSPSVAPFLQTARTHFPCKPRDPSADHRDLSAKQTWSFVPRAPHFSPGLTASRTWPDGRRTVAPLLTSILEAASPSPPLMGSMALRPITPSCHLRLAVHSPLIT